MAVSGVWKSTSLVCLVLLDAVSGYANGSSETTRYELISQTGHAETVQVTYDAGKVTLREILLHFSVSSIL